MKRKQKIMFMVFIVIIFVVALIAISVLILRLINSNKNKIHTENGIQESTYIDIDGMKQYIQIRGENTENPVMIFAHGGPVSPMGYVSAYYQRGLESEVTILYENKLNAARTALEKDEIKGTEDEQDLTSLIKRMSQVKTMMI